MERRNFLTAATTVGLGLAAAPTQAVTPVAPEGEGKPGRSGKKKLRHVVNHSVCRWCFSDMPLPELLPILKGWGVRAIDLVGPADWPVLKEHDIACSMCNGAEISLVQGWNDPLNHEVLVANYEAMIPKVAEAGYVNLICFSGNRNGMDDYVGLQHCVEGLSKILPMAEEYGVVIQMELFNAIDHPDYMCDSTLWGVELCRRLGSPNFKLLYDIYHMQIQEGDIIRTIRTYHEYLGHYHTAGVPGRHEIGTDQELYYPAIVEAIHATGFKGYIAQEFIPTGEDKLASLEEAFRICDIEG